MMTSKSRHIMIALITILFMGSVFANNKSRSNQKSKTKKTILKKSMSHEQSWAFLKKHVEKESSLAFNRLTKGWPFRRVNMQDDQAMIQKLANRLSRAAGRGDYNKEIVIARMRFRNVVNAMTFPGGQMIYLTGILKLCKNGAKKMAAEKTPLNRRLGTQKATRYHYERLVAAVLGHEMGHYYGQHFMRRIQFTTKNFNNTKINLNMEQIRFGQEHEIEADEFSMQVMKKAGYNPEYVVKVLKLLKEKQQQMLKRGNKINPYTQSHPTGNARVAAVASKAQGKEFYERMVKLELAFAAIETGADLDLAVETIEEELKKFPKNTYLLTAAAKIYHRRWEKSCSIEELQFKSSIASMAFRDEMISAKLKMRSRAISARSIPGNVKFFRKADVYYRKALKGNADFLTGSSYAVLLVYDPGQVKKAIKIGELAAKGIAKRKGIKRFQVLNNLGIIYYFIGDYHNAEKSFKIASGGIKRLVIRAKRRGINKYKYIKRQKLIQGFSTRNTGKLFEALFNLGQLYNLTEYPKIAKSIWRDYLTILDWQSDWAKYAALQIDMDLKKFGNKPTPSVAGISPGMTIAYIIRNWGTPDSKTRAGGHRLKWIYKKRGITLYTEIGVIKALSVRAVGSSVPVLSNGVHIKMQQRDVVRKFGMPPSRRGSMVYYPQAHMILTYDAGKVSEIVVWR